MKRLSGIMVILRVILLAPLALLYLILSELRRCAYRNFLSKVRVEAMVISVGNITSGGTGKTPFVDLLVKHLRSCGKRVAVVSRPYRAANESNLIERVSPNLAGAAGHFGDEPVLLARRNPDVSFYVGPSKSKTALEVVRRERPDFLIVDDGFQHLKLHRDFEFLLLDATEPAWHYLPLPSGYGRDAVWHLRKADLVVVTKENLVEHESSKTSFVTSWTKRGAQKTIRMTYAIGGLFDLESEQPISVENVKGRRAYLFSGIGRPDTFEVLVQNELSIQVAYHKIFSDHYVYQGSDAKEIGEAVLKLKAEFILTTEKDAVKLKGLLGGAVPIYVVQLSPQITNFGECLDEILG